MFLCSFSIYNISSSLKSAELIKRKKNGSVIISTNNKKKSKWNDIDDIDTNIYIYG